MCTTSFPYPPPPSIHPFRPQRDRCTLLSPRTPHSVAPFLSYRQQYALSTLQPFCTSVDFGRLPTPRRLCCTRLQQGITIVEFAHIPIPDGLKVLCRTYLASSLANAIYNCNNRVPINYWITVRRSVMQFFLEGILGG